MKKNELLQAVLASVEAETEISASVIISKSKKEEVVDARHIVVRMLSDFSLYPSQIAELMGISYRCVIKILNEFPERVGARRTHRRILRT